MTGASRKTTAREAANLGNQRMVGLMDGQKDPGWRKLGWGKKRKKGNFPHYIPPILQHDTTTSMHACSDFECVSPRSSTMKVKKDRGRCQNEKNEGGTEIGWVGQPQVD